MGQIVSAVAAVIICAASVTGLAFAASRGVGGRVALLALLGLGALATAAATLPRLSRLTVEEARRGAEDILGASADPVPWWDRPVRWVTSHQKVFSTYETFTDGRVDQRTTLSFEDGSAKRVFLPLYRSYLEIEFRRVDPLRDLFEFAFTAVAVTGQATRDDDHTNEEAGEPAVIDGFRVQWEPEGMIVDPRPKVARIVRATGRPADGPRFRGPRGMGRRRRP